MKDRERRTPISQPTAERTADQSTQSASGLGAERPGHGRERQYDDDKRADDRLDDRDDTDDAAMPADDASLNTKI